MKTKKLIYGFGINDADYVVQREETLSTTSTGVRTRKVTWVCPYYSRWVGIITRCYSKKFKAANPSYRGCSVSKEWKMFSNFRSWMEEQDWEGKQIDKDILKEGNKIYSPEFCVFVDSKTNSFITSGTKTKRLVGAIKGKYAKHFTSSIRIDGKAKSLGRFETEVDAHKAWAYHKFEQAKVIASNQTDKRVSKALLSRYEKIYLNSLDLVP